MKNRIELAKYFAELGFNIGAEVGVYRGEYAHELCKANPTIKIYLIDSWGTPPPGKGEGVAHKRAFKLCAKRLAGYDITMIKKFSMDAVKDFEDNSLDFVYIDADHTYHAVCDDIREWTKKVRVGGIVAGHDYLNMRSRYVGVKDAVDEYVSKNGYKLSTTIGDGVDPRDYPSWYFIKTL